MTALIHHHPKSGAVENGMEISADIDEKMVYTPLDLMAGSMGLDVVAMHATGKMVYTRYLAVQSKKLIICRQDFSVKSDTSITLPATSGFTGLVVAVKNNFTCRIEGNDHFLKANQFNLVYLPPSRVTYHFRKGEYTIISIPMKRGYLSSLADYKLLLQDFSDKAGKELATWHAERNLDTPGEVKSILRDFFSRLESATLSQLYFEKITLDLRRLLLDRLSMEKTVREKIYVTSAQEEIIWKVREFMQRHLESFFTTAQVAAWHGIDQVSLTKGYKLLTGKNLMEEIADMRMNKAKELLEQGKTVERTAHAVGYKNYNNFSSAFKRKFGFPPSYLSGSHHS